MRLEGAWGKKQFGAPRVRTWGLSEANVLYWRIEENTFHIVGTFGAHRSYAVPPSNSDSSPGYLCPPCTLVRPLLNTLLSQELVQIDFCLLVCFGGSSYYAKDALSNIRKLGRTRLLCNISDTTLISIRFGLTWWRLNFKALQ